MWIPIQFIPLKKKNKPTNQPTYDLWPTLEMPIHFVHFQLITKNTPSIKCTRIHLFTLIYPNQSIPNQTQPTPNKLNACIDVGDYDKKHTMFLYRFLLAPLYQTNLLHTQLCSDFHFFLLCPTIIIVVVVYIIFLSWTLKLHKSTTIKCDRHFSHTFIVISSQCPYMHAPCVEIPFH